MNPIVTFPWAFLAAAAIPALVAIYWFRNRFKRHTVSSLMLWMNQRQAREGGVKVDRLQTPLLFFLELIALALLVLAAASPKVLTAQGTRPLVVVLDDPYSMLAHGTDSPRSRGVKAIEEELRRGRSFSVRFVLAGRSPQLLGEPVKTQTEAMHQLNDWRCLSPTANLTEAIGLASEIGGERAMLLVMTDRAPDHELEKGRIQWWAFGRPAANLAFVNAARTSGEKNDRCLLEIANLSKESGTTTLVVEGGDPPVEIQRTSLALEPGEQRRVTFTIASGSAPLRARLNEDALEIDNQVTLLPEANRTVRVANRVRDAGVRLLLDKAIRANHSAVLTETRPDLIFTDQDEQRVPGSEWWTVRLLIEKEASPYLGPFVLDRAHPLTEGLSLQGVVWAAGKEEQLPGGHVITAGNVPLVTDAESPTGRHDLRIRLRPDLSTLQDSPDWPILIANVLQWRASRGPGLSRVNLRLGSEAVLNLESPAEKVQIVDPHQHRRDATVHGKSLIVKAEDVGLYEIGVGEARHKFASNALYKEESDLRGSSTCRMGDWLDETTVRVDYQSIAWLLLLAIAALMTLHMTFIHRQAGGKRP